MNPNDLIAAEFLLFMAEETSTVCIQDLPEGNCKAPPECRYGLIGEVLPGAMTSSMEGKGVFFAMNETDGKGRKSSNVTKIRALVADYDDKERNILKEIDNLNLPPHVVVNSSPGKYHVYWKVSDCPLEMFKPIQQAIARTLKTDLSVCDLPRVMRLPGTIHYKGAPHLVTADIRGRGLPDYTVEQAISGLGLEVKVGEQNTVHDHKDGWSTEPVPEYDGPNDDDELISKMLRSKPNSRSAFGGEGGASFFHLWTADPEALGRAVPCARGEREYDASRADAALCSHLAFWTGRNCERIDRLFRLSGLYRDKWENRQDYRYRTVTNAVQRCNAVYSKQYFQTATHENLPSVTCHPESQRLNAAQQKELFAGCTYILYLHRVLTPDGDLIKPEQFNAIYGGYDFIINAKGKTTRKAWDAFTALQNINSQWAHGPCFRPGLAAGQIILENKRRLVNVFFPAFGEQVEGDVSLFLTHVEKILPDERDREIFLSYLAACVQRPGVKFQWCVLLQGVEGNGKTVFYHILAYALGERYAHLPNAADITNPFNGWLPEKFIIGIEELHTAGRQDVADTLKTLITNTRIEVHCKGQDQRTGDNCANFIMFSNFKDAVLKTEKDRRVCVFYAAQQEFGDLVRDRMQGAYFKNLYDWLNHEGGFAKVAHYLKNRSVNVDVMDRAPVTTSTAEAVRSSLGVAEQLIQEAIDLDEYGFRGDLVCTKATGELLYRNGKKLSPQKVAAVLANLGFIKHPALTSSEGKVSIEAVRRRIYTKRGSLAAQHPTPEAVAEAWKKAQGAACPSVNKVQRLSTVSDQPQAP